MIDTPLIGRPRAGWLSVAAGVALVLAQALLPAMPDDNARQVAVVAAHRGAVEMSAAAFLLSGILLVLAVVALNAVPVPRARGLVRTGLVLTGIGAAWPIAGRGAYNAVMVALAGAPNQADAREAAHVIGSSGSFAIFLVTLVAFALGPIVLSLGLWRARVTPPWPALLWLAGVIAVNATSADSRVLATVAMAVVAAGLAWLGLATAATGPTHDAVSPASSSALV